MTFPESANGCGPVLKKLRETLAGIQACDVEGPAGWVVEIPVDESKHHA